MRGFIATWWATVRAALRDPGTLLLVVAPVLYSLYYPWPYLTQTVTRVPVAVVDLDHTGLTRQIARFVGASPKLQLVFVTSDEHEARSALQRREIEGYAVLPRDLKRDVVRAAPVVVPVLGDGAYFLLNKTVLAGFGEAIGTVSAGAEIKSLQARGQAPLQAVKSRSPVNTQLVPLFNPSEGYGSYVVPAVTVLIVQQLLLISAALWVGSRFETPRAAEPAGAWLARMAAFSSFGLVIGAYYFGLVYWGFDYARGGNFAAAFALLLPFSWCAAALGVALGAWFADRERAMQALLFTSLLMVFLAGFSWPREALHPALQALGALLPTTPGIQAFLRLNQMGAHWAEVQGYAVHIAVLAVAYTALALWVVRWRGKAS